MNIKGLQDQLNFLAGELEQKNKNFEEYKKSQEELSRMSIRTNIVAPVGRSLGRTISNFFSSKVKRESLTNVDKEGYLVKEGGIIKSWQKRWFVLKDGTLYYFKTHESQDPRGYIPLSGCKVKPAVNYTSRQFCFSISHPKNRTYYLCAKDQEELEDWVATLVEKISNLAKKNELIQSPQVTTPNPDSNVSSPTKPDSTANTVPFPDLNQEKK